MKLSVLILTLATLSSTSEISSDDFLRRAASQLDRLSVYKQIKRDTKNQLESIPYESLRTTNKNDKRKGDNFEINSDSGQAQEILLNEDAMRRIDELATNAYKLYNDPNYEAIMRERIKRSGSGDFISGIAGSVLNGVTGLSGGSSSGSSGGGHAYDSYGAPVQPYEKPFSIWDFKKAIINTVIQAVKAIAGSAIAFKGHLIKGGGFVVQTAGRVISSGGEAAASLGSQLASSALIAQSSPVAHSPPTGYSYNPPQQHDYSYDGPPPSHDSYSSPESYNNGHYDAANDGPGNEAGLLLIKPTKSTQPLLHNEDPRSNGDSYQPQPEHMDPSGPMPLQETSTKTAQLTKLIGLITGTIGSPVYSNNHHTNNNDNYQVEHKDQDQPTAHTHALNHPISYQTGHDQNHQSSSQPQDYGSPGYQTELAHQQIRSLINPYLGVPINPPMTFKDQSFDYAMSSDALKIPILNQNINHNEIDALMAAGPTGYASSNFEIVPSVQVADWSRSIMIPRLKKYQRRHVYENSADRFRNKAYSNKRSKIYYMF
ncbi:uncharacterized protein LOC103579409 [Microplitis demolitor]|uniref:uncharacterized protein LOC103579409 n=1 Tax=Microplitis demolitor TaxID=69319 RepID=UPI0004CCF42B|nr:uncharacterized protein LOC103579409 [Microplitis demolitor]